MTSKTYLRLAWVLALVGMLGSLFFSEIAGYTPCILCWYQRIFLYPIAILTPFMLSKNDPQTGFYLTILAIPGTLIALFHNLLVWDVISEKLAPCKVGGPSCITQDWSWGFITIPLLSLLAFLTILVLVRLSKKKALATNL